MALLFADSFDHYASAQIGRKYLVGTDALTPARNGNGFYLALLTHLRVALTGTTTVAAGSAYYSSNLGSRGIHRFTDDSGSQFASIRQLGDGRVYIDSNGKQSGISTFVFSAGIWYFVELKATVTLTNPGPPALYSLDYQARVNEETILSGTLTDIQYASGLITRWWPLGPEGGVDVLDDVWITDGELLGDIRVIPAMPNADGTYTDFTPSSAGAHYLMVDDATPDDDSTYLEAALVGDQETQLFETSADTDLKGIQMVYCVDPGVGALTKAKPLLKSGASEILGDEFDLDAYTNFKLQGWRTSPHTSSDWTAAELNAQEAGVEITA